MTDRWIFGSAALAAASLLSCHEKTAEPAPTASGASGAPRAPAPPTGPPLRFSDDRSVLDFGLPRGCSLELPSRRAPLGAGTTRFLAPRDGAIELAVATDTNADGRADFAGIAPTDGSPTRPIPWVEVETPPAAERSADGWVTAFTERSEGAGTTAFLWSEKGAKTPLGSGDRLSVWDVACADQRCAVLTTLAAKTASSGASLFVVSRDGTGGVEHADARPGPERPFLPHSILSLDAEGASVAITDPRSVQIWRVRSKTAERVAEIPIAHRLYDVVPAREPVAVEAGSPPDACEKDRFELAFSTASGKKSSLVVPVAPDSLVARKLDRGFFLVWVSPVSCRRLSQPMVFAALLDPDGAPASSAMAVGEASGFAASTKGDRADLWLAKGNELVWLRGRCSPKQPAEPKAPETG